MMGYSSTSTRVGHDAEHAAPGAGHGRSGGDGVHTLGRVRVSARADYAIRALIELAAARPTTPLRADAIAAAQGIPPKYLGNLLSDLRRARLVVSQRGQSGGYRLARAASTITIADVIRAIDGPLADVRDSAPEDVAYDGAATSLRDVWVALRASIRAVLEQTTLADVVSGKLPPTVRRLLSERSAWTRR